MLEYSILWTCAEEWFNWIMWSFYFSPCEEYLHWFPYWLYSFALLLAVHDAPLFPINFTLYLSSISLLILTIKIKVRWNIKVALIYISLIAKDDDYFLKKCLSTICIPSFENCLVSCTIFKIGIFVSLMFSVFF